MLTQRTALVWARTTDERTKDPVQFQMGAKHPSWKIYDLQVLLIKATAFSNSGELPKGSRPKMFAHRVPVQAMVKQDELEAPWCSVVIAY
eukprot:4975134-Amphidinium_carterae.1